MIIEANITSNKTTAAFKWRGGKAFIQVAGTFDGATVQVNAGQDGLTKKALINDIIAKGVEPKIAQSLSRANIETLQMVLKLLS